MSRRLVWRLYAFCLLAAVLSACASSATPSSTESPVQTATATPTPRRGIDHDAAQPIERAIEIDADLLASRFDESRAGREAYLGRFVAVTGVAVRRGPARDGGMLLELEGAPNTSVLCEVPRGLSERRVTNRPFPSDGLLVLVAGRVSETRSQGDVVLVDCTVLKTGTEVIRSVAQIPAITNIFQGWGLFWAWASLAVLGYLLAFRRWRTTSPWLLTAFVLFHTGGIAVLYALFGSLVLPYYSTNNSVGSLAAWPFILALNPM